MGSAQELIAVIRQFSMMKKIAILAIVGSLVVMVLEPSHTEPLPILAAYALWLTHLFLIGLITFYFAGILTELGLRWEFSWLISIILAPFLFAPVSMLLDLGFGNPDEEVVSQAPIWDTYLGEVFAVMPVVLVISVLTGLIAFISLKQDVEAPLKEPVAESLSLNKLFGSVPKALGNNLIRLQAQDHYVELVTDQGKVLLSERFSDCVAQVEVLEGVQCHRSHWVRLANIEDVKRDGKSYFCKMSNGDRVPVSRRKMEHLRQKLGL